MLLKLEDNKAVSIEFFTKPRLTRPFFALDIGGDIFRYELAEVAEVRKYDYIV